VSKLPIAGGEANNGADDIELEVGLEKDPLELGWTGNAGIMGAIGDIIGVVVTVGSAML